MICLPLNLISWTTRMVKCCIFLLATLIAMQPIACYCHAHFYIMPIQNTLNVQTILSYHICLHQNAGLLFYSPQKTCFWQNFAANFLLFLVFRTKNAENDYFNQHLECTAPKRWSKYTKPGEDLLGQNS